MACLRLPTNTGRWTSHTLQLSQRSRLARSGCVVACEAAAASAAATASTRQLATQAGWAPAAPAGQRRGAWRCRAYSRPEVYDIAFNFRDYEKEAAHLLAMHRKHCRGAMQHFLEVACGPARHATTIAAAAGAAATGLDLSPAMLRYAGQLAEAAGVAGRTTFIEADMTEEGWSALVAQPADAAAVLLGSLAHCLDNGAALACFRELGKAVRPGGLLVLELPHPGDLWGGYCLEQEQFVEAWEAQSEDGGRTVLVEWGREGDEFDLQQQVLHRTVGLSMYAGDELECSDVDTVPQRQFTLQEIELLGRAAGFEVAEVHGDFDASIDLDHEEAFRSVVCLLRQ